MSEAESSKGALTRRGFLKGAGATAGALGLAGVAGMTATSDWLAPTEANAEPEERVAYTFHKFHCLSMCPLKCTVRDGRLVHIEPNSKSCEDRYQTVCLKGISEVQHVYSAHRVQTPLKRVGERGEASFVPVSWDEALNDIAEKLKDIQSKYGNNAVLVGSLGEPRTHPQWYVDFLQAQPHTLNGVSVGVGNGFDPAIGWGGGYACASGEARDWVNSKMVLHVGTNYCESSLTQVRQFFEAKEAGVKMIVVDPHFTTTASKADEWIPINPGTDAALFLAMISCVLEEDLADLDFMRLHTSLPFLVDKKTGKLMRERSGEEEAQESGEDNPFYVVDSLSGQVVPYTDEAAVPDLNGRVEVDGNSYVSVYSLLLNSLDGCTAEWASEITAIPAERIKDLAREYAQGPTCLSLGWGGNDKLANGDISGHAAAILVAVTGNIGKVGAHAGVFAGGTWGGQSAALGSWTLPDYMVPSEQEMPIFDYCYNDNSVKAFIMVGDWLVQRFANANAQQEWVKTLDLVVAIDPYFQEGDKWADYVLPATTRFELDEDYGIIKSGYNQIVMQGKVLDPLFEAKTDLWIQKQLADRMGVGDALPSSSYELCDTILKTSSDPYINSLTVEKLAENNCVWPMQEIEEPRRNFMDYVFYTPSTRMDVYYDEMVDFGQALPKWEPPLEATPDNPLRDKYPFQLFTVRSKYTLHAQFNDAEWIRDIRRPCIDVNPADLDALGIESGETVEVYNDRGCYAVKVNANNAIRPGTVRAVSSVTTDYTEGGNLQALTNDAVPERGYAQMCGPNIPYADTLVGIRKA